jgi:hypothetical protein
MQRVLRLTPCRPVAPSAGHRLDFSLAANLISGRAFFQVQPRSPQDGHARFPAPAFYTGRLLKQGIPVLSTPLPFGKSMSKESGAGIIFPLGVF